MTELSTRCDIPSLNDRCTARNAQPIYTFIHVYHPFYNYEHLFISNVEVHAHRRVVILGALGITVIWSDNNITIVLLPTLYIVRGSSCLVDSEDNNSLLQQA